MSTAQPPRRSELVPSGTLVSLAPDGDRRLVLRSGAHGPRCRWIILATLLPLVSFSQGIAGCSPSGAAANPPGKPAGKLAVPPPGAERPKRVRAKPVAIRTSEALPGYVLPFEARSNPFALPRPEPSDRSATTATAQPADVKLVGLMMGGRSGPMAALEVEGREFIVCAGATLGSSSGTDSLHIVEIRENDIVVRQNGRQRIITLPRP
jgi:hypothetical protein